MLIQTLLAIIGYGLFFSFFGGKKKHLYFMLCATVHILVIHAFRDPFIFPDNEGYASIYDKLSYYKNWRDVLGFTEIHFSGLEYGYMYLNYFIACISKNHDPEVFFITTSCIMVLSMMFVVYKTSKFPLVSVLMYFTYPAVFYQSMYVLRQHLACCLIIFAIYFMDKKYISIILALLAVSFHTSAIYILPYYVWRLFFIKKISIDKIIGYGIVFVIFMRNGMYVLLRNIERYESYAEGEESSSYLPIILLATIFISIFVTGSYAKIKDFHDKEFVIYLSFVILISVVILGVHGGGRFANYFMYSLPLVVPVLLKYNTKETLFNYVCLTVVAVVIFYLNYIGYKRGIYFALDYKFYWQ